MSKASEKKRGPDYYEKLTDRLNLVNTPYSLNHTNCEVVKSSKSDRSFGVHPILSPEWGTSRKRLLVVLESIDTKDIKNQNLMHYSLEESERNPMTVIFPILFQLAHWEAKDISKAEGAEMPAFSFALGFFNWSSEKTWNLKGSARSSIESRFQDNLLAFIEKTNPTHILICGERASQLYLGEDFLPSKYGWVYEIKDRKVVPTLDVQQLYSGAHEDDDFSDDTSKADLLYFVQRNITNLLLGKNPFSIRHVKPNPVFINTIDKFDKLMEKLRAHPEKDPIGLDTETRNLSSTANELYTVQLAFTESKGIVLPVDHFDTPFDEEQRLYIKKELRRFFAQRNPKTFITFNGVFDWRIIRSVLKIPFIYHKAYEIQAGENLLDENIVVLGTYGDSKLYSLYNLRNLITHYGNDWYYHAPFSKEERDTISTRKLDKEVLDYCAMDVQSIKAVSAQQLRRAFHTPIIDEQGNRVRYAKYFSINMRGQMSDSVHALSTLEQNGSPVDVPYMKSLIKDSSPLTSLYKETLKTLRSFDEVIEANSRLGATSGLFGQQAWELSFTKPGHKRMLFFDVMQLEPISKTASGELAVDKAFIEYYEKDVPIVEQYGVLQKIQKLQSTYVVGWLKLVLTHLDSNKDHCLRAAYSFIRVVTGRLASFRPNLQQIPSRGKLASVIKRMFAAPEGTLGVRADYSAHEVRFWGNTGRDEKLSSSFQAGTDLRKKLIVTPKEKRDSIFKELKTKGDIHLRNIFLVFGKWVDKSHPWRDQIKSTIFGLIYGMSRKTQSLDTKKKTLAVLKAEVLALKKKLAEAKDKQDIHNEYAAKYRELQEAESKTDEDWLREAEELEAKIYATFPGAAGWLEEQRNRVLTCFHVISTLGRRRILYRIITGKKQLMASAQRRGCNSPIQGESSEIAIRAAYLTLKECYEFMRRHEISMKYFPKYTRAVHDANYFIVAYSMLLPFLFIFQHCKTKGISDLLNQDYGWKLMVDPDIEIEISSSEDTGEDWNWTLENLRFCIDSALKNQAAIGKCADVNVAMEEILEPFRNADLLNDLQTNYPLLGQKLPKKILEELMGSTP